MRATDVIKNGLWHNNPATVQLLGLCPLLAVSNTAVNALSLGLATVFVLVVSNSLISLFRNHIPDAIRVPTFVLIIASAVTVVELLMSALSYELYQVLGIFIPLIVTNCSILGRAEAFASKNPFYLSFLDGLMQGLGFLFILMVLGMTRELLGQGTLFAGIESLWGAQSSQSETGSVFLLALLPPGAFMILGFFIALKNWLEKKT